jgi:molybdate transport system regulatory protein
MVKAVVTAHNVLMKRMRLDLAGALGQGIVDKRIDILRRIDTAGSISEAARAAGVSYKAAWQAVETLSNLTGAPLVQRVVGGAGGGGAALTDAGRRLLQAAELLRRTRRGVVQSVDAKTGGSEALAGLAALALRTSMRNQLPCVIGSLRTSNGSVRVELALRGGDVIRARITRESCQLLGLRVGQRVLALCKATAVEVGSNPRPGPGRNLLHGSVSRLARAAKGQRGREVTLQTQGGLQVVGFASVGVPLRKDRPAVAAVDEAGVVIAIAG